MSFLHFQVYRKLSDLLRDYPELVEMFVGFLEPSQARDVGKVLVFISRRCDLGIKIELSRGGEAVLT